jgi:hypothetical protein
MQVAASSDKVTPTPGKYSGDGVSFTLTKEGDKLLVTHWKWGNRVLDTRGTGDPQVHNDFYHGKTIEGTDGRVYGVRGTWNAPDRVSGNATWHQGGHNGDHDVHLQPKRVVRPEEEEACGREGNAPERGADIDARAEVVRRIRVRAPLVALRCGGRVSPVGPVAADPQGPAGDGGVPAVGVQNPVVAQVLAGVMADVIRSAITHAPARDGDEDE